MHDSSIAYSRNGEETTSAKDSTVFIGQRNDLSTGDILEINAVYGCELSKYT